MKRILVAGLLVVLFVVVAPAMGAVTNYGDVTLTGGFQSGHFADVYDLTAGDITLSFTYDGTGMVDDYGVHWPNQPGDAHAWSELGVRSLSSRGADFNPYWRYTYWTKTVDLVAGRENVDVGEVIIWGDGANLYVKFVSTDPDCFLTETHLAIATSVDGIPQTKKGDPIPGQFPYKMEHNPPVTEYTYSIDATQWGTTTKLFIAAHAALSCEESAWATTYNKEFEGANWATYITYTPIKEAGSGIWLATDYDGSVNTFDPDPAGAPNLDMDDKLILQRVGGYDEGQYNLPSSPAQYGNNYGFWFDRDSVDQWQALMWGCIGGGTYNTNGLNHVVITLHAIDTTTGTAYMTVNGVPQGFYNGPWYNGQPALYPVGQTFTGDMRHLQVFYGLYGFGATHSASFTGITVTQ